MAWKERVRLVALVVGWGLMAGAANAQDELRSARTLLDGKLNGHYDPRAGLLRIMSSSDLVAFRNNLADVLDRAALPPAPLAYALTAPGKSTPSAPSKSMPPTPAKATPYASTPPRAFGSADPLSPLLRSRLSQLAEDLRRTTNEALLREKAIQALGMISLLQETGG
jgi:hypothetical protein